MITLSNGMMFDNKNRLIEFTAGMRSLKDRISHFTTYADDFGHGVKYGQSTAIAAIDVAIENAELALKSASQPKGNIMKAAKKPAAKPVAKKPALKTATKKPVAKKK